MFFRACIDLGLLCVVRLQIDEEDKYSGVLRAAPGAGGAGGPGRGQGRGPGRASPNGASGPGAWRSAESSMAAIAGNSQK